MVAKLRHRLTILLLAIYWPAFFLLAHISIPDKIQKAGVSDKCLHFLAYFTLTFLLWFSINPNTKATLRKASLWLVVALILLYAVADEAIQGLVGRNCDIMDIVADAAGLVTGLVLFSFLTFWPAALILTACIIFGIANVSKTNLADVIPVASSSFHLLAYACLTGIWIHFRQLITTRKKPNPKSIALALGIPTIYLAFVCVTSILLGRSVSMRDTILSLLGVGLAVLVWAIISMWSKREMRHVMDSPAGDGQSSLLGKPTKNNWGRVIEGGDKDHATVTYGKKGARVGDGFHVTTGDIHTYFDNQGRCLGSGREIGKILEKLYKLKKFGLISNKKYRSKIDALASKNALESQNGEVT